MAQKIQLPNGAFFPVKEGESKEQALAVAQQMYPDAFAPARTEEAPQKGGSGLGDIARSFGLGAVGATGALASVFGADNAAARGLSEAGESLQAGMSSKRKAELQMQAERMKKAEESGSTWQEIKAGLLNVLEAPVQSAAQAVGSFVPMVATLPLAKVGLGARAIMAVRGAIGGAQGAGSVKQSVYEAVLRAEEEDGKSPEQAQAAAVRAQEYVGANLDQIMLGTGLGVVAGSTGAEKILPGGVRAQAGAAQQALAKRLGERAATGLTTAAAEMPLEGIQGGQERLAANLALQRAGRDVGTFTGVAGQAAQEALTGGLGGGALGAALPDRTMSMAAAEERKKQQEAKATAAAQQRLAKEQQAAAEEEAKKTPEYAMQVGQQYETLLADFKARKAALKTPGKDATPVEKAEYADAQKALKELNEQLKEIVPEYRRTAPIRAQAQEQARVAGMDPFDYMMEQAGEVTDRKIAPVEDTAYEDSGLAFQDPLIPSVERRKAQEAEQARVAAIPTAYAAERIQVAKDQMFDPSGQDYVDYLLQDPYKASLLVETRTPLPGLSANESTMIRNNLAKRLKAMDKDEMAARQADLQAQKPGKEQANPMAQFLADQDMLDVARQEGFTESDIAFVERQAAMERDVIEQGELFGEQRVGQSAGVTDRRDFAVTMADLQRQLDIAVAQRNTDRGGQYRETIRGLIEQIRDLQSRTALPTTGALGQKSAGLQEQLGQFPQSLQDKRAAEAQRQAALANVAAQEEGAQDAVAESLVNEIRAARPNLRPETLTEIEREVRGELGTLARYGANPDVLAYTNQRLDAISQKWRSGVERGETFTRTTTPTTTSPDMLREQMDRAFAQNDQSTRTERREKYAPEDTALLNQIADNFNAFAASPDRLNMAGEWLNRLTTTGRPSPEMTRDLKAELARLEEGKRSETETPMRETAFGVATKPTQTAQQMELPERFMPKAVRGEAATTVEGGKAAFGAPGELRAPEKKSTAFATAAEFQKYLAGDALKLVRQAMGAGKDTASRMHARLGVFQKKIDNITKQLASLQERKKALQDKRGADANIAKDLFETADTNLKKIYERLDTELLDLQVEYMQARQQFDFTAQTVADIGQKIADNIAAFQSADTAAVEAAQKTAEAKNTYATAVEQPVTKRNFSALRQARRGIITALEQQITASRKAGTDENILAFLNADLNLQLQLQAEEKALDRDAQVLLNTGLALEEAAATQKRSRKNQKELKQAQQELAAATGLKRSVDIEMADTDAQIAKVEGDIARAEQALSRTQQKASRPAQQPEDPFEKALAAVKIEPLSSTERAAIAERDRKNLQEFQDRVNRLNAITGQRIDFTKRREMLELINAAPEDFAKLDQKLKDIDTGIEEMQIAAAIAEEALAVAQAATPEQTKLFTDRIAAANGRIESLRSAKNRYEKQQANLTKALAEAERVTSSDPEVVAEITAYLDKRIDKLNQLIPKKQAAVDQAVDPDTGEKVPAKTLTQRRKDLAKYKKDLDLLIARRSNRLGIQRLDATTGERVAPQKKRRMGSQEQTEVDEALERAQAYGQEKERLDRMQDQLAAMKAAKQPRSKAAQEERAEKIRDLQDKVNKQQVEVDQLAPRTLGRVSQATRIESSAPGKFRAGTAESKAEPGTTKRPVTESRAVALPTASEAVADANAFAKRLMAAKTAAQRTKLLNEQDETRIVQLEDALYDNVESLKNRVRILEEERAQLAGAKSMAAVTRLQAINRELTGAVQNPGDLETSGLYYYLQAAEKQLADFESALADAEAKDRAQEDAERAEYGAYITELGEVEGGTEISGFDMGLSDADGGFDFDSRYRVSKTTGPSMSVAQVQKVYDALTGEWVNKPQTVVVADEKGLPVRIRNQAERDNMTGKIPGLYDPVSGKVYLVASNLRSVNDVILTTVHEIAGHFGLQKILGDTYTKTMNDIYSGNAAIRKAADAKMKQIASLKKETAVEEALAEQAELDPNAPDTRSAMRKIYDTLKKWVRDTLGFKDTVTDAQVNQILANARKFVIEGGEAGKGVAGVLAPAYRSKQTVSTTPALDALADKLFEKPKTFKQKLGNNLALEAEMQGVDMRAGLRDVLKAGAKEMGDDKLFTQAMYNVLKADQKMPLIYTVMSNGPLETYRDDKGLIGVRSTNKNSAKDVYEAVAALPGKDAAQKDLIATAYMVAQRTENKGLEKLDAGALGVEQSMLDAVLAEAKADPELRKGLEAVRTAYNAYNKGMIDFLATTGAIPKAVAKKLNEAGDYVPFYRVNDDGTADLVFTDDAMITIGDIRRQPYLAELKGGETKLLSLSESLPRNTILLTDKALTNMATKDVAYGLQSIGAAQDKMKIQRGKGPADPRTIRFNQEPDPNDPKDTGERFLRVDTEGTIGEGVPSELLVKSLEGAHLPLPGFLKLAGRATDLLRAGVTRTPLYLARQLIREPMAAAFTGGLNYNAFTAVLKGGMKFVQMTRGNTDAEAKLLEKGLIQSGIFTGDVDDMGKFALQLAGNNQSALERLYAAADRAAIRADAATRSLVYENALANGLSEVEADFMTMESMNFYKRGLSPSVQYASRMIPFFNAQIQGLNVLYKAATGKMPFEEQQQIKRKFFNNAVLMMASGIVYAMAMEDDETWRNARPRDKMTNFFIPLPGTDELLKFPIPFEAGYFYSLAVAAVDGMREQTDNKEQWAAIKDLFINSIPGASSMGVPQIIKPIAEVWTNKNFMSGSEVESRRLQGLSTEERYNATTTELAKQMSKALPILSPIQIEHIVRGYFGVLPLAAVAAANGIFEGEGKGEKPEKRLSETALVGSAFQKKFGGADSDVVFRMAGDAMEARTTLNKMLNEGRREDAIAYREKNRVELQSASAAGQYRQLVGRINADLRRTQERTDLTAAEKRARIDKLDEAKQQAAQRFVTMVRRIEGAGA